MCLSHLVPLLREVSIMQDDGCITCQVPVSHPAVHICTPPLKKHLCQCLTLYHCCLRSASCRMVDTSKAPCRGGLEYLQPAANPDPTHRRHTRPGTHQSEHDTQEGRVQPWPKEHLLSVLSTMLER